MRKAGIGLALLGLAGVELVTWRASREALPASGRDPRRTAPGDAVVVLGCHVPILQRWRVRIAVRSTNPQTARFVFTGAVTRGQVSEARAMADYAVDILGVPPANVVLEEHARTTIENIVNSAPLVRDAPVIKIASNTFHARRARRILTERHPELAARLVRARDYLPLEGGLLHAGMLAFELYRSRRA